MNAVSMDMPGSAQGRTLRELPPHLASYLLSRFGLLAETSTPDLIDFVLEERRLTGLRYLEYTLLDAELGVISVGDLILRLRGLVGDPNPSLVMSGLIHQVSRITSSEREQVLQVLRHLHESYGPQAVQPRQRVIVDRALMRLLHHMEGAPAFELAARCATSPRSTRRQASYRFYHARGVDGEARRQLVANYGMESTHTYRTLITTDAEIARRIGVWTVLNAAPSSYWRRRIIEHFLDDEDCLDEIARTYPDELLWAIRTVKRPDLADLARRVFHAYRTDSYLVNCAIQCLSVLGNTTALAEAVQAGRTLLTDNSSSGSG
jgi:hypothetical protein